MIIDAENALLGRLAAVIAKKALNGEAINVVNCEKAVLSGDRKKILAEYKRRQDQGTHTTGPYTPKIPERLVKRTIRGMLPYKNARGREALSRVKCFRSIPEELMKEKIEKIESCDFSKLKTMKHIRVEEICRSIGGKI